MIPSPFLRFYFTSFTVRAYHTAAILARQIQKKVPASLSCRNLFLNLLIEFSPVGRKGLPDHRDSLSTAMDTVDFRVGIRLQMLVDAEKMADLIGDMCRQIGQGRISDRIDPHQAHRANWLAAQNQHVQRIAVIGIGARDKAGRSGKPNRTGAGRSILIFTTGRERTFARHGWPRISVWMPPRGSLTNSSGLSSPNGADGKAQALLRLRQVLRQQGLLLSELLWSRRAASEQAFPAPQSSAAASFYRNRKAFCSLKIVQYNAKNDFSQPPAAQIFDIASLTSERLIL